MDIEIRDREIEAFEHIAEALNTIGRVMAASMLLEQKRFDKEYPEKGEVRYATVTHRQTEEERLREAQGQSDESDEEWRGRRETEAIAQAEAHSTKK